MSGFIKAVTKVGADFYELKLVGCQPAEINPEGGAKRMPAVDGGIVHITEQTNIGDLDPASLSEGVAVIFTMARDKTAEQIIGQEAWRPDTLSEAELAPRH